MLKAISNRWWWWWWQQRLKNNDQDEEEHWQCSVSTEEDCSPVQEKYRFRVGEHTAATHQVSSPLFQIKNVCLSTALPHTEKVEKVVCWEVKLDWYGRDGLLIAFFSRKKEENGRICFRVSSHARRLLRSRWPFPSLHFFINVFSAEATGRCVACATAAETATARRHRAPDRRPSLSLDNSLDGVQWLVCECLSVLVRKKKRGTTSNEKWKWEVQLN